IGGAGAANAALLAASVVALHDEDVRARLIAFREEQSAAVTEEPVDQ
ncbi:MAG: 5-(carboxyamino)imidazole ribonucleotide mutase, partial [Ponticaulis sp.]|nr:5-(carboxyamino)imidazole ribonucleotide mutase [Ponticaulis sp.]